MGARGAGMGARGAGIGARGAGMGAARLRVGARGAGVRKLIRSRASAYACSVINPCLNSVLSCLIGVSIITTLLQLIYLRVVTSLT